jgi:hypothetical protein
MGKSLKKSRRSGRLPKEESEPIKDRAAMIYLLVRQGVRYKDAWKRAWPRTRAAERNWSRLGKRDFEWYRENFEEDAKEMMRVCDLDPFTISTKLSSLMQAKKSVGQLKKGDDVIPIMAPDNGTQARAVALAANIWGMTDTKETMAADKLAKFELLLPVIISGLTPTGRQQVIEAIEKGKNASEKA